MTDPSNPYGSSTSDPGQSANQGGKGLAIAALVLGILALVLSWTIAGGIVLGLVALVLGIVAAVKAKRGTAGGRVMAIIGAVLGAIGLLIGGGLLVAAVLVARSDSAQSYGECLDQAGQDQAAAQECANDFAEDLTG